MGEKEQKLTIRADAKGFEDAAKKVAKVTEAQADLEKQIEEVNEAVRETVQVDRRRDNDSALQHTKNLTTWFGKLAMAIWGSLKALRYLAAGSAALAAGREILSVLRVEIELRERLVEIMRAQGEAMAELKNEQLDQEGRLIRISDRRRGGGFASALVSNTVQQAAATAQKQYTLLGEANIDAAFGNYGDIEGLSARDLLHLAIIDYSGQLEPDLGRSPAARERYANRRLQQFRDNGLIEQFERRENVRGEGTGYGEYRPKVTKRAKRAFDELKTMGSASPTGMARLKELLPADFATKGEGEEKSRVELAADLYKLLGGAAGFERAKVGVLTDLRPLTTLINKLRDQVEIALPDQAGFGAQFQNMLGLTEEFETMRSRDYEEILKALRTIDRMADPDRQTPAEKRAAEDLKRAADAMEEVAVTLRGTPLTVIHNNQNAKFIGTDADARSGRVRNGVTLSRSREGV